MHPPTFTRIKFLNPFHSGYRYCIIHKNIRRLVGIWQVSHGKEYCESWDIPWCCIRQNRVKENSHKLCGYLNFYLWKWRHINDAYTFSASQILFTHEIKKLWFIEASWWHPRQRITIYEQEINTKKNNQFYKFLTIDPCTLLTRLAFICRIKVHSSLISHPCPKYSTPLFQYTV